MNKDKEAGSEDSGRWLRTTYNYLTFCTTDKKSFSLSVLQKRNSCLELDARIPRKAYVPPRTSFRGKKLFHETAEDLFILVNRLRGLILEVVVLV